MNWHISHPSSESDAPATNARPLLSLPMPPFANNVDTFDVPSAHASQPSCKSGLLVIPAMWTRTATPRSRSSWKSSGARGESHGREYGGSASNVMLPLSMEHLNVPGAVMNGVISALDHRKYSCMYCNRMSPLINYRIKKAQKDEIFDPELVAAVEAKLKALDVESDALT
jgi:hypothetical protein